MKIHQSIFLSVHLCVRLCVSTSQSPPVFVLQAQRASAMRLQHDLAKKYEDQMLKQIEELLRRKSHLGEHLVGWSLNQYLPLKLDRLYPIWIPVQLL